MKLKKLVFALSMASMMLFSTGCSISIAPPSESSEPLTQISTVDTSEMTLETGTSTYVSASYDPEKWYFMAGSSSLSDFLLYDLSNTTGQYLTMVNFAFPEAVNGMSLQNYLNALEIQLAVGFGSEVKIKEIRALGDDEIGYMEITTTITDAVLDATILAGELTEEAIEAAGGREVLKATPPSTQILMIKFIEDKSYAFSGTYYDETHRDTVLEALTVVMQTFEPVE